MSERDPLCELGKPYSKHTHPHECNFNRGKLLKMPQQASAITAFACPPLCEHQFDGPEIQVGESCFSRTCSKCGMAAIDVAMWE